MTVCPLCKQAVVRTMGIQEPRLTMREREVVGHLAQGRRGPEIAALMDVSQKTVAAHQFNLMKKIGAHSTADVVRFHFTGEAYESRHILAPRCEEVAAMVSKGMSNPKIGKALGISEHTVKQHLQTIYRTLNVGNRVQLVNFLINRSAQRVQAAL